ncbi:MAG TPA: MBL fold metallo-hydrolase [Mariprofundaceae bacterium]|nr:MBL fold metallo-hydrolase [Mariprofundaceae bacterium]
MNRKAFDQYDIASAMHQPTLLYEADGHAVYWLGNNEPSAFRTNVYLIRDGDVCLLVDPGNRSSFDQIKDRVAQILPPESVTGMVVCHQDPDVAASLPDWLEINPAMQVFTTPRTQVLLPYYGRSDYAYMDVEENSSLTLPSGAVLYFISAPFLHFPGAFSTFDVKAGFLFSGDVFASLGAGEKLWSEDFDLLTDNMNLFHLEYMASNVAARGFVNRLDGLDIKSILPQHGNLIGSKDVQTALRWLANLKCGTDLIYPKVPLGYD